MGKAGRLGMDVANEMDKSRRGYQLVSSPSPTFPKVKVDFTPAEVESEQVIQTHSLA